MPTEVVLVGAGGFGRETLDVIEAHNLASPDRAIKVLGIADDAPIDLNLERLAARGYRYLGPIAGLLPTAGCRNYVLGIGSPAAKLAVDRRFTDAGWRPTSVIHPAAVIGSLATIGEGVVVCSGVQVSTNVTLGRHVQLNPNSTIGHDTVIGDHASVNPGAIVSGEVTVGSGVLVGAGAIILQQLSVGAGTTIGAGAVVTRPTPEQVVVKGVPGTWG